MEAVRKRRSPIASILVVLGIVGAMSVLSASPSTAWDSLCDNGEGPTDPTTDEAHVDVSGVLLVGVDLELHDLPAGTVDPGVCVNNELYNVTVTTAGGPYVNAGSCTGTACTSTFELGKTGLVGAPALTTTIGSTTVCVGICTTVPFTPVKVDTGYDVYVAGTKEADLCVSVGTTC